MARNHNRDSLSLPEPLFPILEKVAQTLFFGGLLALLVGTAVVVINYARGSGVPEQEIVRNINLFAPVAFYGAFACAAGASYLFWGEEILGPLLLVGAGIFLFAPAYLPLILTQPPTRPELILDSITKSGYAMGGVGLFVLIWDIASRMRLRAIQGAKADQLRFGKGIREESDIRNVFLGRCWQLPYCRKFVRERCPIYHARRTCWKERVGCMCEEQVIRNAMEGKVIPREMVAAAKFIPYNSRLSPEQKKERCRQCVIYNEHQKHKYRASIPMILLGVGGLYFLTRVPASAMVLGLITAVNRVASDATVGVVSRDASKYIPSLGGIYLNDVLTAVLYFILAVYLIRFVETLFFRMKI